MGQAENIESVRRFYGAGPADQDDEREDFFAPDAVWHVPGANPVSGDYRGVAAITDEISSRMAPLDRWTLVPRHVMANGHSTRTKPRSMSSSRRRRFGYA